MIVLLNKILCPYGVNGKILKPPDYLRLIAISSPRQSAGEDLGELRSSGRLALFILMGYYNPY